MLYSLFVRRAFRAGLFVCLLSMPLVGRAQAEWPDQCPNILAEAHELLDAHAFAVAAERLEPCIGSSQLAVYEQAQVFVLLAEAYYEQQKVSQAIATLETLLNFYTEVAVENLETDGDLKQVLLDLQAGMGSADATYEYWRRIGDRLFEAKAYIEATTAFDEALMVRPNDAYAMARMKLAAVFDEQGVATTVAAQPEIEGGVAAIYEELRYPKEARRMAVEGNVVVRAVVDADGTVTHAEILRGLGYGCDEEVLRVVQTLTYTPALYMKQAVPAYLVVPVQFRLRN